MVSALQKTKGCDCSSFFSTLLCQSLALAARLPFSEPRWNSFARQLQSLPRQSLSALPIRGKTTANQYFLHIGHIQHSLSG